MTPRQRRHFLQNATRTQFALVEETCFDLIKNPVGLSDEHSGPAAKKVKRIKRASDRNISHLKKKEFLGQRGGYLNILITFFAAFVGTFF